MAVKIRLARFGTRNNAFFRIVVSDTRAPRDGHFIEQIGTYDPRSSKVTIVRERVAHWQQQGAKASRIVTELMRKLDKDAAGAQGAA